MFIDTSVIVAILAREDDADHWATMIEGAAKPITSPLVMLEAAMRLSTKLALPPHIVSQELQLLLVEADIEVVPIDENDGRLAIDAFEQYGKGRGHPAQLNLADCLSYACARNRDVNLLYKGKDFARTDLA